MTLVYLGTDFHDTPLPRLEQFERAAPQILESLNPQVSGVQGVVLLATCNRFEVYVEADSFHDSLERVTKIIAEQLQEEPQEILSSLKVRYADSVSRHLFSVASGLESMIVGEEEIAGQVKRSLAQAHRLGYSTKVLNQLFQSASNVAKSVSTQTGLGVSGRSIITTALELAATKLAGLENRSALLIGTGAYSRVVVAALLRLGVTDIRVYSRSGRAHKFSENHATTPVAARDLAKTMTEVDLVVSASGNSGYAVDLELARQVAELRAAAQKPELVVIDVSLAKDVDPLVSHVAGISVIDLEQIKAQAPQQHMDSVEAAKQIVTRAAQDFEETLATHSVDPVLTALRAHVGLWVEKEVETVRKKSGDDAATEVERSLRRVANAILHTPSVKAKELAVEGNHEDYIRAVRLLFDIEVGEVSERD
ncbi:MAG: glutamyl-tRNA reductase [Micrococcales bacterium]